MKSFKKILSLGLMLSLTSPIFADVAPNKITKTQITKLYFFILLDKFLI